MASLLIALISGAIVGWIGSLAMRTDSTPGILTDVGVGAFAGFVVALTLTSGYWIDAFLAAALAAMLVVGALAIARRLAGW